MEEQKITRDIKAFSEKDILKKHFSEFFNKNGEFDFEKFKKYLSENEVNFSSESYGLEWLGKSYAQLIATDPATTLLKADENHNNKTENANSENLLIKGDNLEVLKHLVNAYYEKIKMIYIDQPYNTGSNGFVYQDDRKFTPKQLAELAGIDEQKAKRILNFTRSKNNSHSAWLTFMYPRLYIARQLLRDDGVIFVSIDDNEIAQLRLLMDEIFGEENFVACLPTIMNLKGNNDQYGFSGTHEYTLVYAKNLSKKNCLYEFSLEDEELEEYNMEDEIGMYKKGAIFKRTGSNAYKEDRPNLFYPIWINPEDNRISLKEENGWIKIEPKVEDGRDGTWRWSKEKLASNLSEIIVIKNNGEYTLYKKQRLELSNGIRTKKPKSIFYRPEYSSGNGSKQIKELFSKKVFDNPKPVDLIKDFIEIGTKQSDIILDFFAGSGTTGHTVMQLNAENGGNRKFILVQLPESIDPKKNKAAYDFVKNELKAEEPTIFEITKERLIRAAKKIKTEIIDNKIAEKQKEINELKGKLDLENKNEKINQLQQEIEALKKQDLGFKIFEIMPIWEDYNFEAEKFDSSQTLFDEGKLTESDIKALLTTWKTYDGIPLTQELEAVTLIADSSVQDNTKNYTAYYGSGKLYLMYKGFTADHLKALLEKIDSDKHFEPKSIIAFGYHFDSARLRELSENVKSYSNKKQIDIDFIVRY